MTEARRKKLEAVLSKRQPDLAIVIENVDDPHNIGAILRSCDAFGVMDVHLLYTEGKAPRLRELRTRAAASSVKWLNIVKWDSRAKLVKELKKQKMTIAVTAMTGRSKDPAKVDLTKPLAIVIGNEHFGVSKELVKAADVNLRLPMVGFIQSFNVSVATALLLYEAFRQREKKGMYDEMQMTKAQQKTILKKWTT